MENNQKPSPKKENEIASKNIGRRKLLKTSALGLGSLAFPVAGAVAQSTEHSYTVPDRVVDDGAEITSELSPTEKTMSAMDASTAAPVEGIYELTNSEGETGFLIAGTGMRFVEYDLTIDPNEHWYDIESIESIDESEETVEKSDISTQAIRSYSVQITQHDPGMYKLCRTKQTLRWNHNGSRVTYKGRNRNGTRSWHPTGAGTNWYTVYKRWNGSVTYLNNRRALASTADAKFYNTDFPGCGRTDVRHKLRIEGYKNGGANHYPTIWRSGCAHELLHSHTRVV